MLYGFEYASEEHVKLAVSVDNITDNPTFMDTHDIASYWNNEPLHTNGIVIILELM